MGSGGSNKEQRGDNEEEPSLTRWTFEDFEAEYEALLGITCSKPLNDAPGEDQKEQQPASRNLQGHLAALNAPLGAPGLRDRSSNAPSSEDATAVPSDAATSLPGPQAGSSRQSGRPKGPPMFYTQESRDLADSLSRDIFKGDLDVRWDSIKGLETAKQLLKEAVVMPIKYPRYFKGLLTPWKGILLFGPPGTGKTMLAKAVAAECNTTFFNISASSIVSKFRGDSEKLVRVLFEMARHYAPSTIFLDELDSIISHRGDGAGEHEASRRLKTELLLQMDGLGRGDDLVFLLAATNLPWQLDSAMLRRLEKRILVPLPEPEARRAMFEELLPSPPSSSSSPSSSTSSSPPLERELEEGQGRECLPYKDLVAATAGFSGSDIRLVCKEAAMRPLRRLMHALDAQPTDAPHGKRLVGMSLDRIECYHVKSASKFMYSY
eukprot:jgi/Mesen1/1175/ME000124S00210